MHGRHPARPPIRSGLALRTPTVRLPAAALRHAPTASWPPLVGLAAAHLVAALTVPAASPVLAVGSTVIDLTPTPMKEWAIRQFGTADKPILVGSVLVVVLLLAGSRESSLPDTGRLASSCRRLAAVARASWPPSVPAPGPSTCSPPWSPPWSPPRHCGGCIASTTRPHDGPAPGVDGSDSARGRAGSRWHSQWPRSPWGRRPLGLVVPPRRHRRRPACRHRPRAELPARTRGDVSPASPRCARPPPTSTASTPGSRCRPWTSTLDAHHRRRRRPGGHADLRRPRRRWTPSSATSPSPASPTRSAAPTSAAPAGSAYPSRTSSARAGIDSTEGRPDPLHRRRRDDHLDAAEGRPRRP